ncbi:MAG TPA: DUF1572 family protein [Candidatus Acidoferrales bacterium]|nr:DUF1572 family protein [Candidatus Acidoferrales bacterium]
MTRKRFDPGREILDEEIHRLKLYSRRILKCLDMLPEDAIWWRPNAASNSAGNLALHLAGNVRQWIISGLGGAADVRQRDHEFSERGPMPRRLLATLLARTVNEACGVLKRTPTSRLGARFSKQGFTTTRLRAIAHVTEHFAYHAGQILYITKLKLGRDLRFTRLPKQKKRQKRG